MGPAPGLSWDGETLGWEGRRAAAQSVSGFMERYSPWTGRAWLEVQGPGWRIPVGEGYGELRASLRQWLPDRPMRSQWSEGRFPSAALGLPPGLTLALGAALVGVGGGVVAWTLGVAGGLVVVLAGTWLLARLRDGAVLTSSGLRLGPPWSAGVPWFEVQRLSYRVVGRRARVWARTRRGGAGVATLPAVLLPALRARARRLGEVELTADQEGLDATYERWRQPAAGMPWGLLLGTAVACPLTPEPWSTLTGGLLAVAATALLGAAVEARATGWHFGGVFWVTCAYAVVLVAVALGLSGWL